MKNKAMRIKFTFPQYIVGLYVGPRLNCTTQNGFPEGLCDSRMEGAKQASNTVIVIELILFDQQYL